MTKAITKISRIERINKCTTFDISDFESRYDTTLGFIGEYTVKKFNETAHEPCIYLHLTAHSHLKKDVRIVAAYVRLRRMSDDDHKNCYVVDMLNVDADHAGKKLALKMYKFIVRNLGWIIIAGSSQTSGSRTLWYQLANEPGVRVFNQDPIDKKFYLCDVDHEKRELRIGNMSPYRHYSPYHIGEYIYLSSCKPIKNRKRRGCKNANVKRVVAKA